LGIVWAGCLLFLCGVTIADPDLWGHTLYGLRTIELGVLAERTDPFSYTAAGVPWINHEWLTERLFAECWRLGGNLGLVAFRNVCLGATFCLIWWLLSRDGVSLPAAWLLLVFSTECLANYAVFVRPQLATYLGVLATLTILRQQWGRVTSVLWSVPVLIAVWANLHGGFLAGLALTELFVLASVCRGIWVPDRRRDAAVWIAAGMVTALATLVNPYGIELHRMLWHHLVTPQLVLEWRPVWSATPSAVYTVPFAITGLALCASRRWEWVDLLVLAVIGWQAASHIRHIALFCLATLVVLPVPLSDTLSRLFPILHTNWSLDDRRVWRWTAASLLIAFLAVLDIRGVSEMWRDGLRPWDVAVETRSGVPGMPVAAVKEMKRRGLRGNLITDYGWGQFVLWHLWPDVKVAFDGRYRTVYSARIEELFVATQTSTADAPTPLIDEYPTDFALVPAGGGFERALKGRPGWELVYHDPQSRLFVRQPQLAGSLADSLSEPKMPPRWIPFPGEVRDSFRAQ